MIRAYELISRQFRNSLKGERRLPSSPIWGRPKGKVVPKYSLCPLVEPLQNLLDRKILFCEDCVGEKVEKCVEKWSGEEIVLLENLRFHPEEEKNDPAFAKALAAPFDVFVMDAF